MTPLELYYQKIQENTLVWDSCQEMAMQQFQQVYEGCLAAKKKRLFKKQKFCKGLYLWGEVGRGKTYLMDLFYKQLPIPKLRMHFHQFMQEIHIKLVQLQGHANPLYRIAEDFAHSAKIICLDEFLVLEIGDAMLLSQLLHALFQNNITLVTTANTPPNALYQNGLQRELFLPAIEQLKQYLTVFHLNSPHDYRLEQELEKNNFTNNLVLTMTLPHVEHLFTILTKGKTISYQPLSIHGRPISHKGYTDAIIWFEFTSICTIPRSQIDYLAIAKRFSIVLISHVIPITAYDDNRARLFIHLVDVFYDAGIKLILVSETKFDHFYLKGRFLFEFKRTKSRLISFKKEALRFIEEIIDDNTISPQ
ncbi:MAG: cell division protein ZapE [Rickettsiella sp.]|nr:cell division protein ZapE [Rickettsiella sp.]